MKFIIDAQLPKNLSELIKYRGFDSIHTLELQNQNSTSDNDITKLALEQNRIVITKDNDFVESFLVKSEPHKLILIRTGNIPNKELLQIFDDNLGLIQELLSRSNLLEISRTEIVEHG